MKFNAERFNRWFKLSKQDLEISRQMLKMQAYNIAAYFAHQTVEKALKGLLDGLGLRPEKTHSLLELVEQLETMGFKIPTHIKETCRDLDPHYFISRYPDLGIDPLKHYDEKLACKLIKEAEKVFKYVKKMATLQSGERKEN